MGTWGTAPFDNDTAADFSWEVDDAVSPAAREALIRGVLTRAVKATGYQAQAEQAVAAAALVAAQCPGGEPVRSVYGPRLPLPDFPDDLRSLAAEALDCISTDRSGLAEAWGDPADARGWLSSIMALRDVLDPPPRSLDVPLFDLSPR